MKLDLKIEIVPDTEVTPKYRHSYTNKKVNKGLLDLEIGYLNATFWITMLLLEHEMFSTYILLVVFRVTLCTKFEY